MRLPQAIRIKGYNCYVLISHNVMRITHGDTHARIESDPDFQVAKKCIVKQIEQKIIVRNAKIRERKSYRFWVEVHSTINTNILPLDTMRMDNIYGKMVQFMLFKTYQDNEWHGESLRLFISDLKYKRGWHFSMNMHKQKKAGEYSINDYYIDQYKKGKVKL